MFDEQNLVKILRMNQFANVSLRSFDSLRPIRSKTRIPVCTSGQVALGISVVMIDASKNFVSPYYSDL